MRGSVACASPSAPRGNDGRVVRPSSTNDLEQARPAETHPGVQTRKDRAIGRGLVTVCRCQSPGAAFGTLRGGGSDVPKTSLCGTLFRTHHFVTGPEFWMALDTALTTSQPTHVGAGERSPEKAGVGGSIPSLATTKSTTYTLPPIPFCSILFQFQIQARRSLPQGLVRNWRARSGARSSGWESFLDGSTPLINPVEATRWQKIRSLDPELPAVWKSSLWRETAIVGPSV